MTCGASANTASSPAPPAHPPLPGHRHLARDRLGRFPCHEFNRITSSSPAAGTARPRLSRQSPQLRRAADWLLGGARSGAGWAGWPCCRRRGRTHRCAGDQRLPGVPGKVAATDCLLDGRYRMAVGGICQVWRGEGVWQSDSLNGMTLHQLPQIPGSGDFLPNFPPKNAK